MYLQFKWRVSISNTVWTQLLTSDTETRSSLGGQIKPQSWNLTQHHLPAVESTFSQAAAPPSTSSTSFSFGYFLLFTWEPDNKSLTHTWTGSNCSNSVAMNYQFKHKLTNTMTWLGVFAYELTFLVMLCTYGQVLQANLMHFCPSSTIKTFPQVGQKRSMLAEKCVYVQE